MPCRYCEFRPATLLDPAVPDLQNLINEIREHEFDHLAFMQSKVNGLGGPVPPKPLVSLPSRALSHNICC